VRTKPSISIVGAGNVGYHLSRALFDAGYPIKQVVSRSRNSAADIARYTKADICSPDNLSLQDTDIWLISVSDDAISEVATILHRTKGIVLHTSGSTDINVLDRFKERAGVLYPLQTFSRQVEMQYDDIPYLIEARGEITRKTLEHIVREISGKYRETDSLTRMKVHIAAVFACNFSNHMAAVAEKILAENNLTFDLLHPLIEKTHQKMAGNSPSAVQTGPAARGDESILKRHVELLKEHPDLAGLYDAISSQIIEYRKKAVNNE